MKLRNKNTGEIIIKHLAIRGNNDFAKTYNSLAELNEEWEDYEEPKEFWYIGQDGVIFSDVDTITQDYADRLQAIGNYFETEEEAEKEVEKLKAWKRLKDNGFKIEGWLVCSGVDGTSINVGLSFDKMNKKIVKDLHICFGGEE